MTFWIIIILCYIVLCICTLCAPYYQKFTYLRNSSHIPYIYLLSGLLLDRIILSRYIHDLSSFGLLFILLMIANILFIFLFIIGMIAKIKSRSQSISKLK